tara:strand:+ start:2602 stop:2874 length:273 start_codon:yes stop_codon:yes gene_type:complete
MTIELAIFISGTALLFNTITVWALGRMTQSQREATSRLWNRLNYLEVSMSYHGMIPMPWEMEDLDEKVQEIKSFKEEGNVVYLHKGEKHE